jgi:hypothetical protein
METNFVRFAKLSAGISVLALIVVITVLIVEITAPYIYEPYPHLERIEADWIRLIGFSSDTGNPQWSVIYYTKDQTPDPYEVVYNWYEEAYAYD